MGLLRLYLALSVVVVHTDNPGWLPFIPASWAVHAFFVLSGFYMSLALTAKYSDALTFWTNRILRLYPTYLLFVLVYWAWYFFTWAWLHKPPIETWTSDFASMQWWQSAAITFSNWTMIGQEIPNFLNYMPASGFTFASTIPEPGWAATLVAIPPAWSLGVELWFYLLVPLLVKAKSSALAIIGAASGALYMALIWSPVSYFSFPTNLGFFIAGMLVQRHFRTANAFLKTTSKIPVDRFLGNLTYPVYVSHWVVAIMIRNIMHQAPFFIVTAVTLLVASAVYLLLEEPIDKWRNAKFKNTQPAPPIRQPATQRR